MLKLLLLLACVCLAQGFVQLYVVGVPDQNRTNVNKTLVDNWCNAPTKFIVSGSGNRSVLSSPVVVAGFEDSIFICAWLYNVTQDDVGLYNFTGRRPIITLGEHITDSWWGVDCASCYNRTGKPFTECFCGNHSSGCQHKCLCTGGWFGSSCEYSPDKRNYCINNGTYGEADGRPYCSCPLGFTGDRCQNRAVEALVSAVQATTLQNECLGGTLCIISLLVNIFLLALLGFMLYSNRRRPDKRDMFLYHTLTEPRAPTVLPVEEL
ncbi:nonstructural protein 7a [Pteropus rufus nobecovirus]|nr:nonstructural protein 7a [Pteropus rufus nobecovirus]